MKLKNTNLISGPRLLLLSLMFAVFANQSIINGGTECHECKCGSKLVKFEWNGCEFKPEGGDAKGIIIKQIKFKNNEEKEPIEVKWESTEWYICSVIYKAGRFTRVEEYESDVSEGTVRSIRCKAISNFTLCANNPLPVEMTSFSAKINNNLAELNWETATEVNNYGFEVERKILKQVQNENWEKIGFVEGHGNSNSPKYYSFIDNSLNVSGEYSYRLKQIDIDGKFEYTDVVNIKLAAPNDFNLGQNYPNPFNPTTSISYSIPEDSQVEISIYDVLGKEVAVLENEYKSAGAYSKSFNASNLSSGLYFYTIRAGNYVSTKKMLLAK